MGKFWSLVFLLVPIFGVGVFVSGRCAKPDLAAADGLRERRPQHRPPVHLHPLADGRGVRRHRGSDVLVPLEIRRRRPSRKPVKFTHGSHTLEVVWTILPAATLLFIAIYQMNAWADVENAHSPTAMIRCRSVEVRARQFEWRLRYPGRTTASSARRTNCSRSTTCTCRSTKMVLVHLKRHGRAAQLLPAQHAGEARRGAGHEHSGLVPADARPAVRPGLLPSCAAGDITR